MWLRVCQISFYLERYSSDTEISNELRWESRCLELEHGPMNRSVSPELFIIWQHWLTGRVANFHTLFSCPDQSVETEVIMVSGQVTAAESSDCCHTLTYDNQRWLQWLDHQDWAQSDTNNNAGGFRENHLKMLILWWKLDDIIQIVNTWQPINISSSCAGPKISFYYKNDNYFVWVIHFIFNYKLWHWIVIEFSC